MKNWFSARPRRGSESIPSVEPDCGCIADDPTELLADALLKMSEGGAVRPYGC